MGTHPIFESDFDCLTEMSFGLMSENNNPSIWDANAPNLARENSTDLSKLWFDKAPGGLVRDPRDKQTPMPQQQQQQQFAPAVQQQQQQRPASGPLQSQNLMKQAQQQHHSSPQRFPAQQQFLVKNQQSFRPFRPQNTTMIQTGFGQTQQGQQMTNTLIITKPTIRPLMQTGPYINQMPPTTQAFVRSYQLSPAPPQPPPQPIPQQRRNRSQQQTNLHYALSDCQEQFNDLKSELKLRKRCERDNLKTEELCSQFENNVLPALMEQLESCSSEKHWVHIEEHARQIIDKCKEARNNEKRLSSNYGNRSSTLETATQSVTDSLVKLTQCLRVCRTLLWASQVPLAKYPPRLSDSG